MKIAETARLIIEEAKASDAPFFLNLMNSPGWLQFIGDRKIRSVDDAKAYIQNSLIASYQRHQFGLYLLTTKANHEQIGICGLLQRDYLPVPDIGFATLPDYEGKGYTTEAGLAILADANSRLGITNVAGITLPNNIASQRVLEKIGLQSSEEIVRDGETLMLFRN